MPLINGKIILLLTSGKDGCPTNWCTESLTIGSSEKCDGCIRSADVDELHCILKLNEDDQAIICNTAAPDFKTLVDNMEVSEFSVLSHKSILTIGNVSFRFEYPANSKWFLPDEKSEDTPSKKSRPETPSKKPKVMTPRTQERTYSVHSHISNSPKVTPIKPSPMKIRTVTPEGRLNIRPFITPMQKKITKSNQRVPRASQLIMSERISRSKQVSFGPYLSPEQFDKEMPPMVPLKKGATPLTSSKKNKSKKDQQLDYSPLSDDSCAMPRRRQSGKSMFDMSSLSAVSSRNSAQSIKNQSSHFYDYSEDNERSLTTEDLQERRLSVPTSATKSAPRRSSQVTNASGRKSTNDSRRLSTVSTDANTTTASISSAISKTTPNKSSQAVSLSNRSGRKSSSMQNLSAVSKKSTQSPVSRKLSKKIEDSALSGLRQLLKTPKGRMSARLSGVKELMTSTPNKQSEDEISSGEMNLSKQSSRKSLSMQNLSSIESVDNSSHLSQSRKSHRKSSQQMDNSVSSNAGESFKTPRQSVVRELVSSTPKSQTLHGSKNRNMSPKIQKSLLLDHLSDTIEMVNSITSLDNSANLSESKISERKSSKAMDDSTLSGVGQLLKTPKSPRVSQVREPMSSTPKSQTMHRSDQMNSSPKERKSLLLDHLSDTIEMVNSMTSLDNSADLSESKESQRKSSKNINDSVVSGTGESLESTKGNNSSRISVAKSSQRRSSVPMNDSHLSGIRKLLKTPKERASSRISGVKNMMNQSTDDDENKAECNLSKRSVRKSSSLQNLSSMSKKSHKLSISEKSDILSGKSSSAEVEERSSTSMRNNSVLSANEPSSFGDLFNSRKSRSVSLSKMNDSQNATEGEQSMETRKSQASLADDLSASNSKMNQSKDSRRSHKSRNSSATLSTNEDKEDSLLKGNKVKVTGTRTTSMKMNDTNLSGVRNLLKTPKARASARISGVRNLLKTPKARASARISGVKDLMKSQSPAGISEDNDPSSDHVSLRHKSARNISDSRKMSVSSRLSNVASFGKPSYFSTPKLMNRSANGQYKEESSESNESMEVTEPAVVDQDHRPSFIVDFSERQSPRMSLGHAASRLKIGRKSSVNRSGQSMESINKSGKQNVSLRSKEDSQVSIKETSSMKRDSRRSLSLSRKDDQDIVATEGRQSSASVARARSSGRISSVSDGNKSTPQTSRHSTSLVNLSTTSKKSQKSPSVVDDQENILSNERIDGTTSSVRSRKSQKQDQNQSERQSSLQRNSRKSLSVSESVDQGMVTSPPKEDRRSSSAMSASRKSGHNSIVTEVDAKTPSSRRKSSSIVNLSINPKKASMVNDDVPSAISEHGSSTKDKESSSIVHELEMISVDGEEDTAAIVDNVESECIVVLSATDDKDVGLPKLVKVKSPMRAIERKLVGNRRRAATDVDIDDDQEAPVAPVKEPRRVMRKVVGAKVPEKKTTDRRKKEEIKQLVEEVVPAKTMRNKRQNITEEVIVPAKRSRKEVVEKEEPLRSRRAKEAKEEVVVVEVTRSRRGKKLLTMEEDNVSAKKDTGRGMTEEDAIVVDDTSDVEDIERPARRGRKKVHVEDVAVVATKKTVARGKNVRGTAIAKITEVLEEKKMNTRVRRGRNITIDEVEEVVVPMKRQRRNAKEVVEEPKESRRVATRGRNMPVEEVEEVTVEVRTSGRRAKKEVAEKSVVTVKEVVVEEPVKVIRGTRGRKPLIGEVTEEIVEIKSTGGRGRRKAVEDKIVEEKKVRTRKPVVVVEEEIEEVKIVGGRGQRRKKVAVVEEEEVMATRKAASAINVRSTRRR